MDKNRLSSSTMIKPETRLNRRGFLGTAGVLGLGAAAAGLGLGTATPAFAATGTEEDSVAEIFTAILIAEDLATTFYYNVLIGQVIQDRALAGPGGTALNPSGSGVRGNVQYMRSAFFEEWSHANLLRTLLGGTTASQDPAQTFYLPSESFQTLNGFATTLATLENAFIGAYMNAIQQFATKAAYGGAQGGKYTDVDGAPYSSQQLIYFAKVAASILGVESEHRILGRVISDMEPGDDVLYEQTDGFSSVYNGPASAVAALAPFLTPGTGQAFSLQTAIANQGALGLHVAGNVPLPF